MEQKRFGNLVGYEFELFKAGGALKTFITTKGKNAPNNCYTGLNLGLNSGDNLERVKECRKNVGDSLKGRLIFPDQTHGDRIVVVTATMLEMGEVKLMAELTATDALITDVKGCWLSILTADCIPIILFDPVKMVIAAVHAGWRGLENRIVIKTIDKMVAEFGCDVTQIKVGIGPAICQNHYEVGKDVADVFSDEFSNAVKKGDNSRKWQLDLVSICSQMLMQKGIAAHNIEKSGFCSYCNESDFYSYRRDKGKTGRMATGIALM